jgi:hypothetical protein
MKEQFLIIILAFISTTLLGCSCDDYEFYLPVEILGIGEKHKKNDDTLIVFKGTLIDIESNGQKYQPVDMVFKVEKSYIGEKFDTIRISTEIGGSSHCGLNYIYKDWIIFATKNDNRFTSGFCTRSVNKKQHLVEYDSYEEFLDIISQKQDGTHELWGLKISYQDNWLNGLWELKNKKGELIEKGEYLYGKRNGQWQINNYYERNDEKVIIKRYRQYWNDQIKNSMTIHQTYDKKTTKLKQEQIKCVGTVEIYNEYDDSGKIKSQKHSLKEY